MYLTQDEAVMKEMWNKKETMWKKNKLYKVIKKTIAFIMYNNDGTEKEEKRIVIKA